MEFAFLYIIFPGILVFNMIEQWQIKHEVKDQVLQL